LRVVAPQFIDRVGTSMVGQPKTTRVAGAFWALLGAFLTFMGSA
jgi:hypothetical protein